MVEPVPMSMSLIELFAPAYIERLEEIRDKFSGEHRDAVLEMERRMYFDWAEDLLTKFKDAPDLVARIDLTDDVHKLEDQLKRYERRQ